ncbi:DUF6165 family protein [Thermithiobacillus plumbiphilus]|uniref:DUF6165 family protein n=1 Tax=Thermithiobacillus plumbiphilus TaxID=1729899 RepID=A0ABU9DBA3_9PROT
MSILIPGSPGELLDKISILEIKLERIPDQSKQANVAKELDALRVVRAAQIPDTPETLELSEALKAVNMALWDIEDAIRDHEHQQCFDEAFIQLARSVYITNDRRARLKRQINDLLRAEIIEEKSYHAY